MQTMLQDGNNVYLLTQETWDPNSDAYALKEESMTDWEGNMKDPKDWRTMLVFDDIEQETISPSAFSISSAETHAVDLKYKSHEDGTQQQPNDNITSHMILHVGDNVIGSVSSVFNPHQMCGLMEQWAQLGMDMMIN